MLNLMAGDELIIHAALLLLVLNDRSGADHLTADQWQRAQELLRQGSTGAVRGKLLTLDRPTEPSPPPEMPIVPVWCGDEESAQLPGWSKGDKR